MQAGIYDLAQDISAATARAMGRKPLGGTGETTVMVPMRWPPALLARIKAIAGEKGRSAFIRQAVEEKLARDAATRDTTPSTLLSRET
jgi:hypothetical protein